MRASAPCSAARTRFAGRWLEPRSNPRPRGMTVLDRTRLTGLLQPIPPAGGAPDGTARCRRRTPGPRCRATSPECPAPATAPAHLRGQPAKRREQLFVQRMAEREKACVAQHVLAPVDEQRPPPESAQQGTEARVGGDHHQAVLVEQGQHVSRRAARARHPMVAVEAVQRRLGHRKREPGEGVEAVVPASGARRHLAAGRDAGLVVSLRVGRDEADRHAARVGEPAPRGGRIQVVEGRRPAGRQLA